MKQAYGVVLLLLAILPTPIQDKKPAGVCRLESKYDRVTDTTTVQCDLVELVPPPARVIVQANVSFRGKEPNETAKFWFGLSSHQGSATRRTQPLFKEATVLNLVVDSVGLEVPVKDYRNDFYELNSLRAESARAEVGPEDLRKLLAARSLAGKWGDVEFKFSDATLGS